MKLRPSLSLLVIVFMVSGLCAAAGYTAAADLTDAAHPLLTITNNNNQAITGFVMVVNPKGRNAKSREHVDTFYDIYINYHSDDPIPHGASRRLPLAFIVGTPPSELAPEVKAVVYADGSSEGDPTWISRLLRRRQRLYTRLIEARARLGEVNSQDVESLVSDFETREKQAHQAGFSDESAMDARVYSMLTRNLRGALKGKGHELTSYERVVLMKTVVNRWIRDLEDARPAPQAD